MNEQNQSSITRRRFVEKGSATAASAVLTRMSALAAADPPKTGMKYRRFGRTGLMLSEIGHGIRLGFR